MKIFRVSAPFLLVAATLQGTSVQATSLEEAITQTLVSNPQAQASYNRYQASQEAVKVARSGYLPTLDLKASIGHERLDTPSTRSADTDQKDFKPEENSLTLNQNLFDGLSTTNEYRRTRELQNGKMEQLRTKAESLALEVTDVYIKLLESRQQFSLSKNNLASHERIYKLIQQRNDQGVANQADLYQIEGRLARARANLISARNNLEDAETRYMRLVNQTPDELITPHLDEHQLPADLEQAISIAIQEHPAIHSSNHDLSASQYGYDQTRSAFLPTVDLSLTQRWGQDISGLEGCHENTVAMLTMKYNLFRGGSDSARCQEAAYRVEESRAMQHDTRQKVRETLRIAWAAMKNLTAEQPHLKKHMESSAKTVKAYQKQFELGKRNLLDVLDSENENFQAQRAYTNATHRVLFARYRVLNGIGHLMKQLNLAMPGNWQIVDS